CRVRSRLLQPTAAKPAGHSNNLESLQNPQRFTWGITGSGADLVIEPVMSVAGVIVSRVYFGEF
ncbi:hypothetical protein, partial [Kitasatospora sp. NPDC087315]|uniref:hypothetical protein n=1 Tax=Kitasatospora sp. NPDC087315 TaxID=3364069 RepID=UPI0038289F20